MKQGSAVVVANGPLAWTTSLAAIAREASVVLAADGGANHLARIGLKPRAVVGDMDSILSTTRQWIGEERLVHRPDQDRTDLEKTIDHAHSELGLIELEVLAALGGRVDHEIANLGLLARLAGGRNLVLRSQDQLVLAARGELRLPARNGETWSFWTFDPGVRVTLEGVHWPVHQKSLDATASPSISNLATGDEVRVVCEGGAVVVMRQLG